jgi:hypothetical protein
MRREYRTIKALRRGEVVDIGGIRLRMDIDHDGKEKEIKKGDLYIGERNTGPKLLMAEKIVGPGEGPGGYGGWIKPTSTDYSYDIDECVRVIEVE